MGDTADIHVKGYDEASGAFGSVMGSLANLNQVVELTQKGWRLLESAGRATIGVIEGLIHQSVAYGAGLLVMSQRTGVAAETLSAMKTGLELAGTSLDAYAQSLKFLNRNIGEALTGDKEQLANFRQLGITLTDLNGKTKKTDEVFLELADRFKAMPNHQRNVADGMKLLGRGAAEIVPILELGRTEIEQWMVDAKKLGRVWTKEMVEAADQFEDDVSEISASFGSAGNIVGYQMMTMLQPYVLLIKKSLFTVLEAIAAHKNEIGLAFGEGIQTIIRWAKTGADQLTKFQKTYADFIVMELELGQSYLKLVQFINRPFLPLATASAKEEYANTAHMIEGIDWQIGKVKQSFNNTAQAANVFSEVLTQIGTAGAKSIEKLREEMGRTSTDLERINQQAEDYSKQSEFDADRLYKRRAEQAKQEAKEKISWLLSVGRVDEAEREKLKLGDRDVTDEKKKQLSERMADIRKWLDGDVSAEKAAAGEVVDVWKQANSDIISSTKDRGGADASLIESLSKPGARVDPAFIAWARVNQGASVSSRSPTPSEIAAAERDTYGTVTDPRTGRVSPVSGVVRSDANSAGRASMPGAVTVMTEMPPIILDGRVLARGMQKMSLRGIPIGSPGGLKSR